MKKHIATKRSHARATEPTALAEAALSRVTGGGDVEDFEPLPSPRTTFPGPPTTDPKPTVPPAIPGMP